MTSHGRLFLLLVTVLLATSAQRVTLGQASGRLRLPEEPERIPVPEPDDQPFQLNEPRRPLVDRPADPQSRPADVAPRSLMVSLEEIEREQSLRIRRIQAKVERLKRFAEACRTANETTQAQVEPTPTSPELPKTVPDIVSQATEPGSAEPQEVTPPPPTIPVNLTSTVDLLALANNLFAQGKTKAARPIYEQLMSTPQKASDLVWIQYQLASCYRLEGRIKEAKKLYRIVASSKEDDYWKARAHWWLDYLERSQALLERQQGIQAKLAELRKETDELRKQ